MDDLDTEFARLVAPKIDHCHLSSFAVYGRELLDRVQGAHPVSIDDVAQYVTVVPATGLSWEEFGLGYRYKDQDEIQKIVEAMREVGVFDVTPSRIAFTNSAGAAAQDLMDALPQALDAMWDGTLAEEPKLVGVLEPVALLAASRTPFARLSARTLVPAEPTPASRVVRSLQTIRRARADHHADAWCALGKSAAEMLTLGEGRERDEIEEATNRNNAVLWTRLTPDDRDLLVAGLDALTRAA